MPVPQILPPDHIELEREQTLALTVSTLDAAARLVDDEIIRAAFVLARDAAQAELASDPVFRVCA